MKRLQTVLITGSLPVQLDIVRVDTISPILGQQFLNNALLIGAVAILAVALVVFLRYRSFVVSAPMVVAMLSEAVLILGVAALIGWNLDLAAIAGIIIAVGTGVDDQIVIADETLGSGASARQTWKSRMKNAFFIIFAAYFTLVVAMLPLWFAGAGMLRGFAITTILGVSVGVFITRPAYAVFVEKLSQD
jgi:preprotein translocase subunit SecD